MLRFAAFEVDLHTGELRKHGMRIRLQEQPFKILSMLLECPGELVTREHIKERLWPSDTFVDFEHSVNAAMRRLRDALNDHADTPRFIETLPRRGYRFIGQVEHVGADVVSLPNAIPPIKLMSAAGQSRSVQRMLMITALLIIIVVAVPVDWPRASANTIAVLPFTNETNEAGLDYLADGIPGRVIDALSETTKLRVSSRNSSFTFRGPNVKTKDIVAALHVGAVLMGSVRKSGDQLQVVTELIDARDDKHLWGQSYEIDPGRIANIDRIIASAVAEHLHHPVVRIVQRGTVNPIAYDACIRGEYLMDAVTNDSFKQALELFDKATDIDRNYAQAYAAMSKAYGLLAWYGGMPAAEALPLQEVAADRALELDPNNALALINKVAALGNYHRNIQDAEIILRRAAAVAPNDAVVQHVYSIAMRRLDRMDEAVAAAKRAEELDPLWHGYSILREEVFFDARRYDDAIRLRDERPSLKSEHLRYALVFAYAGRQQQARDELAQLKFDERAAPYTFCAAAQAYGRIGEKARGAELLKEGTERQRRLGTETIQGCTLYDTAAAYATLGERNKMLMALHEADRALDSKLQWIKMTPAFDAYRSDPAFQEIVRSEYTPR